MRKFAALLSLVCITIFAGCSTAPDSRTSLTGEICVGGFCITPQVAPQAPVSLYNAIPGGSTQPVAIAPVTAVSAPVAAPVGVYTSAYAAEPLPAPISYNAPVARVRQTAVAVAPPQSYQPTYAPAPPLPPVRSLEK